MRLKVDENGVYTHVAFTEKLAKMARAAKINTTTSSIVTVRENPPRIIHQKITDMQKD